MCKGNCWLKSTYEIKVSKIWQNIGQCTYVFNYFLDWFRMTAGKAVIGKLAPDFDATAVMPNGQFEQLKLSKYRGKNNDRVYWKYILENDRIWQYVEFV